MNTLQHTQLLPLDNGSIEKGVVHAANESRFNTAHYSEPLTTFTAGWKDSEDIEALLQFIAPTVHVGRRFEFKRADNAEAFYSEDDDVRAIGSAFKRVEYNGESVNEKTLNKGLTIRVDHDDIAGDDWQERYVQLLMRRLQRNELRRAIAILAAAASGNTTGKIWYVDGTAANPDSDIRAMLAAAADESGIRPNRIVIGEGAWDLRANCFAAQDNAGAFHNAGKAPAEVSSTLFLEGLRVLSARYQSSASAKSAILGDMVYAFYAEDGNTREDPSNLKRFVTPTEAGTYRVYVEEHAKYTDLSVEHYSSIVATSSLGVHALTVSDA